MASTINIPSMRIEYIQAHITFTMVCDFVYILGVIAIEFPSRTSSKELSTGVTTSRATSWGRRKDRTTSGQRGNKFDYSCRDISVVVSEYNSVVKPKC